MGEAPGTYEYAFCFRCEKEGMPIPGKSPACLYYIYDETFPNGSLDYASHGFDYQAGKIVR